MSDNDLITSKSQRKRDAQAVFDLAKRLVAMAPARLAKLPMDDDLRSQLEKTRGITAQVARKRETQFLAKLLRDRDCAEEIEQALLEPAQDSRQRLVRAPIIDAWAERLTEGGDDALTEFFSAYDGADRQRLRQLIRNARKAAKHRARLIAELAEMNSREPLPPPD